jgi:hypothetical protein
LVKILEIFKTVTGDDLPEIKVRDDSTTEPITVTSAFGNIYNIPKMKIQRKWAGPFFPARSALYWCGDIITCPTIFH